MSKLCGGWLVGWLVGGLVKIRSKYQTKGTYIIIRCQGVKISSNI